MVRGFLRRELLGRASVPGSRSRRLFEFVGQRYENFRYAASTLDDVSVDKPIFIIGSPRSGTSILYNTFRRHPDLAYICQGHDLFPHCAVFADRLFRLLGAHLSLDVPARARGTWDTLQWQRGGYYYSEGQRVWHLFHSRRNPNTTADEITIKEKTFYQSLVKKILKTSGKKRFVNKAPAILLSIPLVFWFRSVLPHSFRPPGPENSLPGIRRPTPTNDRRGTLRTWTALPGQHGLARELGVAFKPSSEHWMSSRTRDTWSTRLERAHSLPCLRERVLGVCCTSSASDTSGPWSHAEHVIE